MLKKKTADILRRLFTANKGIEFIVINKINYPIRLRWGSLILGLGLLTGVLYKGLLSSD